MALDWLRRGQACEAKNTEAALIEAVRCYDEAIALLRSVKPNAGESTGRDLGVAWMNRGNALQKQATPASLAAALSAYDEAIALLRALRVDCTDSLSPRNSLGAAWMNRGLVLHRQATAESIAGAVHSQREAVSTLQGLPRDQASWYRNNLAAAWMNLANALLDSTLSDRLAEARAAARESLAVVVAEETTDPVAAELGLKARRVWCDAIGQLLVANTTALSPDALAAEAGDAVDDALALARRWETRGVRSFRPVAARLFYFGAQLCRLHQPQFLAEFLLEHLDPVRTPDARPEASGLEVAAAAVTQALRDLQDRQERLIVGNPETDRQVRIWRTLKSAEVRIAELRRDLAAGPRPGPGPAARAD